MSMPQGMLSCCRFQKTFSSLHKILVVHLLLLRTRSQPLSFSSAKVSLILQQTKLRTEIFILTVYRCCRQNFQPFILPHCFNNFAICSGKSVLQFLKIFREIVHKTVIFVRLKKSFFLAKCNYPTRHNR